MDNANHVLSEAKENLQNLQAESPGICIHMYIYLYIKQILNAIFGLCSYVLSFCKQGFKSS